MKSIPTLIGAVKCVLTSAMLLFVTAACGKADDLKLWQGSYTTFTTRGAMEMVVMGEASKQEARIRFTLDGRPADTEISQLKLSATAVSFIAMLAGKQYQFTGERRNNQWEGALAAAGSPNDKGTWRLALIDLRGAAASAEAPLPMPTGRYGVGRAAFHWVDEARPELETRAPDDRREVLVYVFYPSEVRQTAVIAPYIPDADVMREVWRDELTDRLKRMRAHSREGVALARSRERFPVAIFAPGGGVKTLAYTTLLEDLASHGYVVAAIEPPYNAPAMQFPGGKTIGRLTQAERGWEQPRNRDEFVRIYQEQVGHWARDMSFVLDRLTALDKAAGFFSRRLDLGRVGAFGHSRGGQVSGTVRLLDARFRGGVNIDGSDSGRSYQPISGNDGGKQPFLWIEKHPRQPTQQQLRQAGLTGAQWKDILEDGDRLLRNVSGGAMRVTIARLENSHMDFSDNPYWDASTPPQVRAGKLRTMAITRDYVRAFFEGCLKGQWDGLRKLGAEAGKTYPDVSIQRFGEMWPQ
jgi:platelet-activating factor acetylhydrolase isoform II